MQYARVVAALMGADTTLGLQHHQALLRKPLPKSNRRRQADDATANDYDIGCRRFHPIQNSAPFRVGRSGRILSGKSAGPNRMTFFGDARPEKLAGGSRPGPTVNPHHQVPWTVILSRLADFDRYANCHPGFAAGLAFLRRPDLADLPDGRHELDGDRLFAIIARDLGRGRDAATLEYHQRYADLQYVVRGFDLIGWADRSQCRRPTDAFDDGRDLGFFSDRPTTWLRVPAGSLAAFFPEDAHAPLGTSGTVHKVVVKVRLETGVGG